jgi:hypothetical protein
MKEVGTYYLSGIEKAAFKGVIFCVQRGMGILKNILKKKIKEEHENSKAHKESK